jgi:hypothetical protein
MALICRKCGLRSTATSVAICHQKVCPGGEMGHAFKIFLLIKGPEGYNSHEVLHYIDLDAAEEAFDALAGRPEDPFGRWAIDVTKLYDPPKKYSRGR